MRQQNLSINVKDLITIITPYNSKYFELIKTELTAKLQYLKPTFENNKYKQILSFQAFPLYKELANHFVFFTGYLDFVLSQLQKLNVQYSIKDYRQPILKLDLTPLKDLLREDQFQVVQDLFKYHLGIVKLPTGYGKTYLLRAVLSIIPEGLKTVVFFTSVNLNRDFYNSLKNYEPLRNKKIFYYKSKKKIDVNDIDIYVSSPLGYKFPTDWPDIVFFDEVHEVATPTRFEVVSNLSTPFRYGFSASPFDHPDDSSKLVKALFGPVRVEASYQAAVNVNVVVPIHIIKVPIKRLLYGSEKDCEREFATNVAFDRYWIWRNKIRNQKIVETVLKFPSDMTILIMVEKIDHALELGRLLLQAKIVCNPPTRQVLYRKITKYKLEDRIFMKEEDILKILEELKAGKVNCVIATYIWKQGVDIRNLNVLVRADGRTSDLLNIQIPGRLSRIFDGKPCGYLVDVYDEFPRRLKARAMKRFATYKKQGWRILDEFPDQF